MKKFSLYFLFLFKLGLLTINAQQNFTLSGIIFEKESNETLIGVNILFPELQVGATTNEYGFYSITLPKGIYTFEISYLGYTSISKKIILLKNTAKNFSLKNNFENLGEIIISNNLAKTDLKTPQMSVNSLSAVVIKEMPMLFGESDIIKAIALLPGVSTAGENSSGFNVRGGASDQNLILLDEATIYNSSHLFGLFSIFNTDAIKDLKLYKGGIPARYGGRVSSVLDIYQKEGNSKKFHGKGTIGTLSSKLLLEGPLKKNKGSFLIGGRSTYAHLFLPLFDIKNKAYFYDINTKLSYRINEKNNIHLSAYYGRDIFKINSTFENNYGNSVLNFRWNHLYSNKLFSNLSLIYSQYDSNLKLNYADYNLTSGIQSLNIKYALKHYLTNKMKFEYGFNSSYHKFNPGEIKSNNELSGINAVKLTNKYAFENAIYLDLEHEISDKLTLSYGLRASSFFNLGQDSLNIYENEQPVVFNDIYKIYEEAEPIRVESYKRTDIIADFFNLEPRLSLAYQVNQKSSLKINYNRISQYLHLLSNNNSPTPIDIWTPSSKYIKPQLLDQYAVGFYKNLKDNIYSLELESFYKTVKNRIDYIDGANLITNNNIEQVLLAGRARAYGLEFMLRKNKGNFKGWLSYTLSKSEQQTRGISQNEVGINNGNWYNTPFDKTHDISITSNLKINNNWKINANFLFQTGQAVTFPDSQYIINGIFVPNYSGRNENRLPTYHRLDLSFNYTPKQEKNQNWKSNWVFGIYNLYNRRNTNSLNFSRDKNTGYNEATRLSIFGIVPSISYNFKF